MKLGVIGGGAMGEAVIAAVLRSGILDAADIAVAERYEDRLDYLRSTYSIRPADDAVDAVRDADFVLLAVKPQDFESAVSPVHGRLGHAVAVSIMAGVPIASLMLTTGTGAVVRSMPNTPAQVGAGMTVWTATADVSETRREGVRKIFQSLGEEAYVPDEHYLDMATALSGSGPAYVFLFLEALTDAGVHVGLSRELATKMALQTVLGSAKYASESGRPAAELRGQVTSPGGTTAAALRVLEAGSFRSSVLEAVIAAYDRSRELGEQAKK
jgi:pyrroline-5-carboxylate reductase